VAVIHQNGRRELSRRELAHFLRSRRERLQPEQVGLPPSRRRRTPGLRREEVAQLAGVGVTWYTWLEQGRDINASPQVLDAIARTLQFDRHEHAHLMTLAGLPETTIAHECEQLEPNVQLLLDALEPYPACVLNARFDLLAWNSVHESFCSLEPIPVEDRNCLWLAFTDPDWREMIVDWDEAVGRMVAEFRASMADRLDDPAWTTLVSRLHDASPEFTALWNRHDVQQVQAYTKRIRHPQLGLMVLEYTNLWLDRLGHRILTFTPGDEPTREKLETLARRPAEAGRRTNRV
jgi:transcriptional regulator with XRE-family HTH domain